MSPVYIRIDRREFGFDGIVGTLFLSTPAHPLPYRCVTLERYWAMNTKNISCIVPGRYKAKTRSDWQEGRADDRQRGWRIELESRHNRGNIQIHWGYDHNDSTGCILIGRRYDGRRLEYPKETRDEIKRIIQKAGKRPEIWVEIVEHPKVAIRSDKTYAPF